MAKLLTEPSVCIPRTLKNVTWRQVKDTFEQLLGAGTVERVDIVPSKGNDTQPFCRIFVHFRYWANTPDIMAIRQRLIDGEVIKVVYDNPWFWKCSASRISKPERSQPKSAPYIEFTGETAPVPAQSTTKTEMIEQVAPTPAPTSRCSSPSPIRRAAVRASRINTASEVCSVRQPDFTVGSSVDDSWADKVEQSDSYREMGGAVEESGEMASDA